mmetsp:Transcript_30355/g.71053  ORF Transcript_30355/g.71053 Transcript_30355/m.71053 type:complete len:219 (-) Transcript_30355:367-1023(-)
MDSLEEYTSPSASPDRVQTTVVNSPSSRSVRRQAAYDRPSSCTVGSIRQIPKHRTLPPPRSPQPAEMVPILSATARTAPYPASASPAASSRTTSNGTTASFPSSALPASVSAARRVRSVPASASPAVSLGRMLTVPARRLAAPAISTRSVPSNCATRRSRGIRAASSAATSVPPSTIRSHPASRKHAASSPADAVTSRDDRTISTSITDGSRPSVSVR